MVLSLGSGGGGGQGGPPQGIRPGFLMIRDAASLRCSARAMLNAPLTTRRKAAMSAVPGGRRLTAPLPMFVIMAV